MQTVYLKDRDGNDTMYPDFEAMERIMRDTQFMMGQIFSDLRWFNGAVKVVKADYVDWSAFWQKVHEWRWSKEWTLEDELEDRLKSFEE